MTEQELREKIVEIVIDSIWKDAEADYDSTDESAARTIADALIAAGIGDVKEANFEADHYWNMWQGACVELERAEHHTEVAEMALKDCIDYYSYSGLCPVLNCNYNKACWRKECTPDIEKCFMIQAEKELAEERKEL